MAIRNKDGSEYKLLLQRPAPCTVSRWDPDKVVFHNMEFPSFTIPDPMRQPKPVTQPQVFVSPATPQEEVAATRLEERLVPTHCLPVTSVQHEDPLYGNKYFCDVYGDKTKIQTLVMAHDSLTLTLWCSQKVSERSIVCPLRSDIPGFWRVESCQPKAGGYLLSCSPSTISPDFSD